MSQTARLSPLNAGRPARQCVDTRCPGLDKQSKKRSLLARVAALLVIASASAQIPAAAAGAFSIVGSKHDLSVTSGGTITATSERQVCVFCHTPHHAGAQPLWNRAANQENYAVYASSTAESSPGQPAEPSLLCLSCHDGTVAVGNLQHRTINMANTASGGTMPPGRFNLTTDLSNDHPVEVAIPTRRGDIVAPPPGGTVCLRDGRVSCLTCHNPHDPQYEPFLVTSQQDALSTRGGQLCLSCHHPDGWGESSHAAATAAALPQALTNAGVSGETVAQAACLACHSVHGATSGPRLLGRAPETACTTCHDGVTATDIARSSLAYSRHPSGLPGWHDAAENLRALPNELRHAECVDCHNPHAAGGAGGSTVGAAQQWVSGVTVQYVGAWSEPGFVPVNRASAQYEICFKCHSGYSYGLEAPVSPSRKAQDGLSAPAQTSPARAFNPGNGGLHAMVAPHSRRYSALAGAFTGLDPAGNPWSWESILLCTDCHGSSRAGDPAGVHGSENPFILKGRWVHADRSGFMPADATGTIGSDQHLCFSCHDRDTYLYGQGSNTAFRNGLGRNLHGGHHAGACVQCHSAVPHGWKNRGLLVETTDAYPYNAGAKNRLPHDAVGASLPAPGEWQKSSCLPLCHAS